MDYEDMVIAEEPNLSVSGKKIEFPFRRNVFVLIVCAIFSFALKQKQVPAIFVLFFRSQTYNLDRGRS